ncbi:MAG: hypothetical protein JWN46_3080, partial [Acidimicrobiales bacterium]|nr:hypothetical protein [Acidimicrobiales bacterium]
MRTARIATSLALATTLALVGASGAVARPASRAAKAVAADSYAGAAEGNALELKIAGQGVSIGTTHAETSSAPAAAAKGYGALLGTQSFGASTASATAPGQSSGSDTPTCSPLKLSLPIPLDLTSGCSSSTASIGTAGPSSRATGNSVTITGGASKVLGSTPLGPLVDKLLGAVQSGVGGLPPLPLPLPLPVPPKDVLPLLAGQLNTALQKGTLVKIEGGSTVSESSSDGTTLIAKNHALGLKVELVNGAPLLAGPLLTIEVGAADAAAQVTLADRVSTGSFATAPVKVKVAPLVAAALKLPSSEFSVPPGQTAEIPLPPPLASTIILSSGKVTKTDNGVSVLAASVELQLLKGLPGGGIVAGLANGSASVASQAPPPPTTVPTTVAAVSTPPPAPQTLPRTGVDEGRLTSIGLSLLAAAMAAGFLVIRASRRSSA